MVGDYKYLIIAVNGIIHSGGMGDLAEHNQSRVLDFIEDSLGQIRYECDENKD